jgi:hypothetical protein
MRTTPSAAACQSSKPVKGSVLAFVLEVVPAVGALVDGEVELDVAAVADVPAVPDVALLEEPLPEEPLLEELELPLCE